MKLRKINIGLSVVAFILLLILVAPYIRERAGMAYSDVSKLSPSCAYISPENKKDINPDICCREIQKQLKCIRKQSAISCSIKEDFRYEINFDQYDYCNRLGYELPQII